MKYKHEFAISHLPKFVIGSVAVTLGTILALTVTYDLVMGLEGFRDAIMSIATACFYLLGLEMLPSGIEYTKSVAPTAVDPPKKSKVYSRAEIDKRIDAVVAMDFEPSPADVKAAEQRKTKELINELHNPTILEN